MNHKTNRRFTAALLATSMLAATSANAAIVTLNGDDVSFTFDDATLFGSVYAVIGNSLVFSPSDFEASSSNGAGAQLVSESLVVEVDVTNPSFLITSGSLAEEGSHLLLGSSAVAAASGSLRATSQNNLCSGLACTAVTSFSTGVLAADATVWSTGTTTALSNGGPDTQVTFTLENLLVSVSTEAGAGELAYISKQYVALGVGLTPVPVPPSVLLMGSALVFAGFLSRRRNPV